MSARLLGAALLAVTLPFSPPLGAQEVSAPIVIEARDFSFALQAHLPAGVTTFTFENHGEQPHSIRFLRVGSGHA